MFKFIKKNDLNIKISLNAGVPPFYGVGLRFLFSGIIFFFYIYYKRLSIPTTPQAIKLYLSFGLLNFSLSYGMTYWATQYIYSSISSTLWGLFPLFTSLMAHFMIKDDPNEIINLAELRSDKVKELTDKMNKWLEKRKKETGMDTPIHDQGDWHGHEGIGSFKSSEQAYNTLRLL